MMVMKKSLDVTSRCMTICMTYKLAVFF